MTTDIIKRELRRRGSVTEATEAQAAEVEKQASADAALRGTSPDEKQAAARVEAAVLSSFDEAIKAALKESKDATDNATKRAAGKRAIQLQTEARAAADAALVPTPMKIKLVKGGTLTLHELNQLAKERDTANRDENRDAASEAGKAVFASLAGRVSRNSRSRHARAAEAARAAACARAVA